MTQVLITIKADFCKFLSKLAYICYKIEGIMIEQISFENYKLFKKRQDLELKPLTILIGKNSSGKSSITKLLPLLEYSLSRYIGNNEPLLLENDGIEIGSEFKDLLYGRHEVGELIFKFTTDEVVSDDNTTLEVRIASGTRISDLPKITFWKLYNHKEHKEFKYNDTLKKYIDPIASNEVNPRFNGFFLSEESTWDPLLHLWYQNRGLDLNINYIGPYRHIPASIIKSKNNINNKLGIKGEDAYPYLVRDILYHNGAILNELNNWYQENFEGWGLNVKLDKRPNYELELFRDNPNMAINFSQVGQGMIQSLPMVLSSFIPTTSADLVNVFEQPELHLHPAAHGALAERFANSTLGTSFKRYLIETHSQNFVLRLRRMVAEGKLDKDNLVIYYVDFDEEKGESNLQKITVFEDGKVDYWPSNIFSETLIETKAIRSAQMQNPFK